jgi:hypothetical protein
MQVTDLAQNILTIETIIIQGQISIQAITTENIRNITINIIGRIIVTTTIMAIQIVATLDIIITIQIDTTIEETTVIKIKTIENI